MKKIVDYVLDCVQMRLYLLSYSIIKLITKMYTFSELLTLPTYVLLGLNAFAVYY